MAGLSVDELDAVLSKRPLYGGARYLGALAADALPKPLGPRPAAFIVNTASSGSGHWEAMAFLQEQAHFFDSYGLPPGAAAALISEGQRGEGQQRPETSGSSSGTDALRQYLERNAGSAWTDSSWDLQSLGSAVCGEYCALFLLEGPPSRASSAWAAILDAPNSTARDALVAEWWRRKSGAQ